MIDKSNGTYRVVRIVGSSSDTTEVGNLYHKGKKWLFAQTGNRDMFSEHNRAIEERPVTEKFLCNIENILLNGTQLILNPVFELTGFDRIEDKILKHLVVSCLCYPRSKVATVDYLKSCFDEDVALHKIYHYLDKLQDNQKETAAIQISAPQAAKHSTYPSCGKIAGID
jgi:hypothetical protein